MGDKVETEQNAVETEQNAAEPAEAQQVKCEVCDISFSSQPVLDAHLSGAKHARKLKMSQIFTQMQENNDSYLNEDLSLGVLKCNICNIHCDSMNQLQVHFQGFKHRKEAAKQRGVTIPDEEDAEAENGDGEAGVKRKKKAVEKVKLECKLCSVPLNSEVQYDQHMSSKKHLAKLEASRPKHQGDEPVFDFLAAHLPGMSKSKRRGEQFTVPNPWLIPPKIESATDSKLGVFNEIGEKTMRFENSNEIIEDLTEDCYKCWLCDIILNSFVQLETHCRGQKHKKKVQNEGFDPDEANRALGIELKEEFHCVLCRVYCYDKNQYDQHLNSNKHKECVEDPDIYAKKVEEKKQQHENRWKKERDWKLEKEKKIAEAEMAQKIAMVRAGGMPEEVEDAFEPYQNETPDPFDSDEFRRGFLAAAAALAAARPAAVGVSVGAGRGLLGALLGPQKAPDPFRGLGNPVNATSMMGGGLLNRVGVSGMGSFGNQTSSPGTSASFPSRSIDFEEFGRLAGAAALSVGAFRGGSGVQLERGGLLGHRGRGGALGGRGGSIAANRFGLNAANQFAENLQGALDDGLGGEGYRVDNFQPQLPRRVVFPPQSLEGFAPPFKRRAGVQRGYP